MVVVTSRPREDTPNIEVTVWYRDLAVYAEIRMGGSPVLGAVVSLGGDVGGDIFPTVTMEDGGRQEPDLEPQDGIYSTYLHSSHITKGRLRLEVEVVADNAKLPDTSLVPRFYRKVPGPVIYLEEEVESPPGRVTDLTVSLEGGEDMRVSWSSPGGDYSVGSVATQTLLYSSSLISLLRGQGEVLHTDNRTVEAGSANTRSLSLPYLGAPVHLAVRVTDTAGLHSRVSNIVTVEAALPETETEVTDSTVEPVTTGMLVTDQDWVLMGIVAGTLLVLLLGLTVSLAYCYCTAPRSNPSKTPRAPSTTSTTQEQISAPSSSSSGSGDEESLHSEMKSIAPQPLPYDDFAKSLDLSQASSPASTTTPLYWSASQLLSKLDCPRDSLEYVSRQSLGYPGRQSVHSHTGRQGRDHSRRQSTKSMARLSREHSRHSMERNIVLAEQQRVMEGHNLSPDERLSDCRLGEEEYNYCAPPEFSVTVDSLVSEGCSVTVDSLEGELRGEGGGEGVEERDVEGWAVRGGGVASGEYSHVDGWSRIPRQESKKGIRGGGGSVPPPLYPKPKNVTQV